MNSKKPIGRQVIYDASFGHTEEQWKALTATQRWRLKNPERFRTYNTQWQRDNKEERRRRYTPEQRRYWLMKKFGISLQQYDTMLKQQKGCCAICSTTAPGGSGKHFAVDHDHVTGKVRALLCASCNKGLGHFQDSAALCEKATAYLKAWE